MGEPLGWPLFRPLWGTVWQTKWVHLRTVVGWRAACCGYSMRHWVLLPCGVGRVGEVPGAGGLRLPLGCSGYTLARLPREALQMCPPHQALGL